MKTDIELKYEKKLARAKRKHQKQLKAEQDKLTREEMNSSFLSKTLALYANGCTNPKLAQIAIDPNATLGQCLLIGNALRSQIDCSGIMKWLPEGSK